MSLVLSQTYVNLKGINLIINILCFRNVFQFAVSDSLSKSCQGIPCKLLAALDDTEWQIQGRRMSSPVQREPSLVGRRKRFAFSCCRFPKPGAWGKFCGPTT